MGGPVGGLTVYISATSVSSVVVVVEPLSVTMALYLGLFTCLPTQGAFDIQVTGETILR